MIGPAPATQATPSSAPAPKKVVFIGASITQYWASYADFTAHNWIDKGIAGQTSPQVAARFQTDVIALQPGAVHILVSTNDLNSSWVPQTTWDAFNSMFAAAHAAGIAVYVGTIPPWGDGPSAPKSDPDNAARNVRVREVNAWLQSRTDVTVIDYYSMLVDSSTGLYNPALTDDGVHPNANGYALMTPVAEQALQ